MDVVEDDDQLTSNSARNHTPIEMAVLYDRYNSEKNLSVQEIAERAGKSVPHVYKYLTAVRKWPDELLSKVQSGELSFTAAQTMYEETRRKKGGDSDESGTVLPNDGKDKSAGKARKNLTKSISESLVSLIFGAEATETEDGYQLSLTKEQYEAVKALQKQIEDEMTGK